MRKDQSWTKIGVSDHGEDILIPPVKLPIHVTDEMVKRACTYLHLGFDEWSEVGKAQMRRTIRGMLEAALGGK